MAILVIHGVLDALPTSLLAAAEETANAIPEAELIVLPDAGHVPTPSNPKRWSQQPRTSSTVAHSDRSASLQNPAAPPQATSLSRRAPTSEAERNPGTVATSTTLCGGEGI